MTDKGVQSHIVELIDNALKESIEENIENFEYIIKLVVNIVCKYMEQKLEMKDIMITFYAFLPQKKGREKLFAEMAASSRASIFYESPHRILKALESLSRVVPERRVWLYRELTKIYEEALVGTPRELLQILETEPVKQKGEFVVIVESE